MLLELIGHSDLALVLSGQTSRKKDFRISPEQKIKAGVKRDSVFFPTLSFDDVSPGGLIVLVVKQESFL